jgi:hypothetical protein
MWGEDGGARILGKIAYLIVIYFQTCKNGIFESNINSTHREHDSVCLVGLEWRGDGETRGRITIENEDQLLLLN